MDDRIALAEFVGWKEHHGIGDYPREWRLYGPGKSWTERKLNELPNPFEDANDDYAVLNHVDDQWPRGSNEFLRFTELLQPAWCYQIGDYARAALKVIRNG